MRMMNDVERKQIEWLIAWIMEKAVSNDYAKYILNHDNFIEDVIADVMNTSAWEDDGYYNEDDVRLAIGRVLMDRFGIDY